MKIQTDFATLSIAQAAIYQPPTTRIPEIPRSTYSQLMAFPKATIDLCDGWIAALIARKFSPSTLRTYGSALGSLLRFLERQRIKDFREVTPMLLRDWQASLVDSNVSPVGIDVYLRAARCLCRWLTDEGNLFINPAAEVRPPKLQEKLGRVVSEKEMMRLLDGITGTDLFSLRDQAILEVAYGTGARIEEIAKLDVESLNLDHRLVHIHGKGARDRILPLTRAACLSLESYLDKARPWMVPENRRESALFISFTSRGRLNPVSLARVIKSRGARAGLELTPHVIRRSIITHMVCRGAPLAQIKAMLGHSSYRHIGRYAQLQTAAMMNLIRRKKKR